MRAAQTGLAALQGTWAGIIFFPPDLSFPLRRVEQPNRCARGSIQAEAAPLEPACSRSLKFPERFSPPCSSPFPSPRPRFLPTIFPPFSCSRLPSPSVPLCAFHHSVFRSITPPCSHALPSLLPLFLPSSYPIPFLSLMLPLAPLCSRVPFCSANTSCLVFLVVQQMFPQRCGDRRSRQTKGPFHFSSRMESDCAAGLRGRHSGDSHAYIQPPCWREHQPPISGQRVEGEARWSQSRSGFIWKHPACFVCSPLPPLLLQNRCNWSRKLNI